jgi:hypothetical protein
VLFLSKGKKKRGSFFLYKKKELDSKRGKEEKRKRKSRKEKQTKDFLSLIVFISEKKT